MKQNLSKIIFFIYLIFVSTSSLIAYKVKIKNASSRWDLDITLNKLNEAEIGRFMIVKPGKEISVNVSDEERSKNKFKVYLSASKMVKRPGMEIKYRDYVIYMTDKFVPGVKPRQIQSVAGFNVMNTKGQDIELDADYGKLTGFALKSKSPGVVIERFQKR